MKGLGCSYILSDLRSGLSDESKNLEMKITRVNYLNWHITHSL